MLSDIEIAQQNKMEKIQVIADKCGLTPDDIEQYGHYKAKISFDAIRRLEAKPDGKLVLVTAITPTPAGEGKSTTSIGLVQGLQKIGKNSYHIMANHLLIFNIITYSFLALKGIDFGVRNSMDIYWFYFPLKTTYFYFVVGVISTTYIGEVLSALKKNKTKNQLKFKNLLILKIH